MATHISILALSYYLVDEAHKTCFLCLFLLFADFNNMFTLLNSMIYITTLHDSCLHNNMISTCCRERGWSKEGKGAAR